MENSKRTVVTQGLIALGCVGGALVVKILFVSHIGAKTPFLLFFGATLLSALAGGIKAGVLATLLAAIVASLLFSYPAGGSPQLFSHSIQLFFFLAEGLLVSYVVHLMQGAQTRSKIVSRHLTRSEEEYRRLVDVAPDAILILQDQRIQIINRRGLELLRARDPIQLTNRLITDFVAPSSQVPIQQYFEEVLRNKNNVGMIEELFVRTDGSTINVEIVASSCDYEGHPAAQVILRDIGEKRRKDQTLRETLHRLTFHTDNSPVALVEWDTNFRVSRWSRQAEQIFGWTEQEVLGKRPEDWNFVFAEDLEPVRAAVARLGDGSQQREVSFNRNYTKSGKVIDCEWYNSSLVDSNGDLISVLSWVLDVTDRKRTEAERDELLTREQMARAEAEVQRNRLNSLLEQAPALICVQRGAEHIFEFANPLYRKVVGNRQLLGRTVREVFPELAEQGFFSLLDEVFATGKPFSGTEIPAHFDRQSNGVVEEGFFNFIYQPIYDIHGNREGIITFAFEVTDQVVARRKVEALARDLNAEQLALKRSEDRFSRLVESNIIGVILARRNGEIVEANDAFLKIVGYSRDDLKNGLMRWSDMTPPEYQAQDEVAIQELVATGRCKPFEKQYFCKDGSRVPVLIGAAVLDGDNANWVCFVLDLSESKRIEGLLRHQAEELTRANLLKDEFLATVSHELRTPLHAILGWSTMLRSKKQDETLVQSGLEIIERNARAQNQLVEDLLDVSRIISGKLRLNIRPEPLSSLITMAIDSVRPAAEAKGILISTTLNPDIPPIIGDPDRLQQIFWNLLSNAVKFTQEGGSVFVDFEYTNSCVKIIVRDTGQGICPDFLPYVFNRLKQADSSTTRVHGGLGLGLAIVRHLVELHGGTIHAYSAGEGAGATFTVELPNALTRPVIEPNGQSSSLVSDRRSLSLQPKLDGITILVVDDEVDAREFLAELLRQSGARVRTAGSATEALNFLIESQHSELPDLIVSDIGMPVEDGYMFMSQVRALKPEQGGSIPAIALTAYARTEDQIKALSMGFTSHICKPVEPPDFIRAVALLTRKHCKGNERHCNTPLD